MKVEFIFAEFRERSRTHHFNALRSYGEKYRLDPTYSSIKEYFPDAKITCYTDQKHIADTYPDVEVRYVTVDDSPFDVNYTYRGQHRWASYMNDYYQAEGLLTSKADVVISVDCDLMFVSDDVKTILPITKKFGCCLPQNPRQLVKVDGIHTRGNDGNYHIGEDESMGNILTYDLWWMSLYTKHEQGRKFYKQYQDDIANSPTRGPLVLTRVAWNSGFYPYAMPRQWGVVENHIGCNDEIILLLDSFKVQDYYLQERLG